MNTEDRFLNAAREEGGQSVSVVGSTLIASAGGPRARVSARTVVTIIRGTTRIDADTKAALTKSVDLIETDDSLGEKDRQDAVETIDRIREELSEQPADVKRVRRFLSTVAAISEPAAAAIQECDPVRQLLAV